MSEETSAQKITSLQRCVSQARLAFATAVITQNLDDLLAFTKLVQPQFK